MARTTALFTRDNLSFTMPFWQHFVNSDSGRLPFCHTPCAARNSQKCEDFPISALNTPMVMNMIVSAMLTYISPSANGKK